MSVAGRSIDLFYPRMVEWRRYLHRNPELSYHEQKTSAFIADTLRSFGYDVKENVGGHGVTAEAAGTSEGPVIALRADIDALPIQDMKTCEYASSVPGVMHACGHDAHTATLLGTAAYLMERRERLKGSVRFLFQPAEEINPGGAMSMIRDGAIDGVDRIYGVHLWTPFEAGTVWTRPGPIMAGADEFRIVVKGKGGHGGLPHQTVDSIYIASQLVIQLQSIVSRIIDPTEPCVVSIGSVHGGTSFNVIAEQTTLVGTVRTFNVAVRDEVIERMERIVRHTAEMYGAEAELHYSRGYPPVVNHEREASIAVLAGSTIAGTERTGEAPLIMAAEDFAYYLQRVPGCFVFVGAGGAGAEAPHHHPLFDIREESMLTAARWFLQVVREETGSADL